MPVPLAQLPHAVHPRLHLPERAGVAETLTFLWELVEWEPACFPGRSGGLDLGSEQGSPGKAVIPLQGAILQSQPPPQGKAPCVWTVST